jgi:uncharacterized protein (TIGR00369 family)
MGDHLNLGIPVGYLPHYRKSPVTDPWEPLFSRVDEGVASLAARIRDVHCNGRGFLHGGVLSALADNAMGLSVIETLKAEGTERARAGLTLTLTIDFLSVAHLGQLLEIRPRVLKAGRTLAFVDCLASADGTPIARGNASFRIFAEPSSSHSVPKL